MWKKYFVELQKQTTKLLFCLSHITLYKWVQKTQIQFLGIKIYTLRNQTDEKKINKCYFRCFKLLVPPVFLALIPPAPCPSHQKRKYTFERKKVHKLVNSATLQYLIINTWPLMTQVSGKLISSHARNIRNSI